MLYEKEGEEHRYQFEGSSLFLYLYYNKDYIPNRYKAA
jgi:hypothetical protein